MLILFTSGRDLCGDVKPSSGGLVYRCTSTSSLDDICRTNIYSNLTCSLIEPNSNPAPQQLKTNSCSSQFFATRINITSAFVTIDLLKRMLLTLGAASKCKTMSSSMCQDSEISKSYQGAHLECHGNKQRLYSCMVILVMSGPVNSCSLNKLMQQLIDSNIGITNEKPLTRMVACGGPGLPVSALLASNLTWVASDLLTSDVCQSDPTLLKCEANETLAVLLSDSCPPTTKQSTTQAPTLTSSNITTATETSPITEHNVTRDAPPDHTTEYNVTRVTPPDNTTEYNVTRLHLQITQQSTM
ncbi:uncharacterized protein LOC119884195 [Micropterus salmoides]|uniref:uncharacterized protein LOC119884195 n=1 Tax=Micropterus salmoides TaxID=27706 RepID=UPI0018ECC794|nr:uncharacterized protein LOC119884195 [Micropterus salmoides]